MRNSDRQTSSFWGHLGLTILRDQKEFRTGRQRQGHRWLALSRTSRWRHAERGTHRDNGHRRGPDHARRRKNAGFSPNEFIGSQILGEGTLPPRVSPVRPHGDFPARAAVRCPVTLPGPSAPRPTLERGCHRERPGGEHRPMPEPRRRRQSRRPHRRIHELPSHSRRSTATPEACSCRARSSPSVRSGSICAATMVTGGNPWRFAPTRLILGSDKSAAVRGT